MKKSNITIGPESIFMKFIDPKNLQIGYSKDMLGYILVTPQNIQCNILYSIDNDLKHIIDYYFNTEDCDIVETITTRKMTQEMYGSMTGVYYCFMSLYVNRLYYNNLYIPHHREIYKYKQGIDIAELFMVNLMYGQYNLYQDIYNYFINNRTVSTYKYVHPHLIKEANELLDLKSYLGEPIKKLYLDLFSHDMALAIALTVQTIFSKVVISKEIKIRIVE